MCMTCYDRFNDGKRLRLVFLFDSCALVALCIKILFDKRIRAFPLAIIFLVPCLSSQDSCFSCDGSADCCLHLVVAMDLFMATNVIVPKIPFT